MAKKKSAGKSAGKAAGAGAKTESAVSRYGGWIAGAILVLLAVAGGYLFWQERQRAAAERHGEELSQVLTDVGKGNLGAAPPRLRADFRTRCRTSPDRGSRLRTTGS